MGQYFLPDHSIKIRSTRKSEKHSIFKIFVWLGLLLSTEIRKKMVNTKVTIFLISIE